jgi:hypothetical protein
MSWLRAFLFNIAFFGVTVLLGIAALPLLLAPRRVVMDFGRFWARCVLALAKAIVGLDGEIRGLEHLPHGACLIAMKHQSAWDTLILPILLGDPAVVIKQELLWVPFYGWYAGRAGSIAVDRKGGAGPEAHLSARGGGALSGARDPAGAGRGQFRALLGPPQFCEAARSDRSRVPGADPARQAAPPGHGRAGNPHRGGDRRARTRSTQTATKRERCTTFSLVRPRGN